MAKKVTKKTTTKKKTTVRKPRRATKKTEGICLPLTLG